MIFSISATEGAEALGAADGGSGLAAFVCGDPAAAGAAVKRTVGVGAISGAAGAAVKRSAGRAFDCVAGAAMLPVAGATGRGCWRALSISAATWYTIVRFWPTMCVADRLLRTCRCASDGFRW